jgi:hypothetical protein
MNLSKADRFQYNYENVDRCPLPGHNPSTDDEIRKFGGEEHRSWINRDINLSNNSELRKLMTRLRELESFLVKTAEMAGVFISYSHKDADILNEIASLFEFDNIPYWRYDKDMLA